MEEGGIKRTCPLKVSSIFAREQKKKKEKNQRSAQMLLRECREGAQTDRSPKGHSSSKPALGGFFCFTNQIISTNLSSLFISALLLPKRLEPYPDPNSNH